MTIKEASVKFNLEEKEIRKRKRDNMIIGVRKEGRSVIIPDDTIIIPSKMEVQTFLLQILQYKNNPQITISRNLCPDLISLYAIMRYVFLRGFVGEYQLYDTIEGLFSNVKLTDDGIKYILGRNSETMFNCSINVPLQINANYQLGGINIA